MSPLLNDNGRPKKQWLPKGIVLPSFWNDQILKLKIRRANWHPDDAFPKYVEIPGSKKSPSIYGDSSLPIIILESELDAMLVQQFAGHLICSVALGGVSKKPDQDLHQLVLQSPLILLSLDFDEAGKKKYPFWLKQYQHARPWPAPQGKSPGDYFKSLSSKIVDWLKAGLSA